MPGEKLCFVVGPIGDEGSDFRVHADWLLKGIIQPVLDGYPEFQVKRADQDTRPGLIDVHMINDILDAELVIADLSYLNPNAFYEIGLRHMAEKPIIHMHLVTTERIPFDVSLYRTVEFALARFPDIEKAKEDLRNQVEAVLAPDYQPENPVTNARGRLKLEQSATPEMRLMMEDIDQIKSRLNTMERLVVEPPNPLTPAAASLALTGVAPTVHISVSPKGMVKPPGDRERLDETRHDMPDHIMATGAAGTGPPA